MSSRPHSRSAVLYRFISRFLAVVLLLQPVSLLANDLSGKTAGKSEADLNTFIIEKIPVAGGAELITVFGKFAGDAPAAEERVPLLSVLRDTLGDGIRENDRLRYVWVFTYARPDLKKQAASAVPLSAAPDVSG